VLHDDPSNGCKGDFINYNDKITIFFGFHCMYSFAISWNNFSPKDGVTGQNGKLAKSQEHLAGNFNLGQ